MLLRSFFFFLTLLQNLLIRYCVRPYDGWRSIPCLYLKMKIGMELSCDLPCLFSGEGKKKKKNLFCTISFALWVYKYIYPIFYLNLALHHFIRLILFITYSYSLWNTCFFGLPILSSLWKLNMFIKLSWLVFITLDMKLDNQIPLLYLGKLLSIITM